MRRLPVIAALLLACLPALARDPQAQAKGMPESPQCQRALDRLQAEADVMLQSRQAGTTQRSEALHRFAELRQQAEAACLGGRSGPSPSQHTLQAPVAVAPVAVTPATLPPPLGAASVPEPPVKPPMTLTHCNAAGCWTREGLRLQRVGPQLIGPNGTCTVVGSMAHCP